MNVIVQGKRIGYVYKYYDVESAYTKKQFYCVLLSNGNLYRHPIKEIERIMEKEEEK